MHLENIQSIKEDNQIFSGTLKMKKEDAEILHFEIINNTVLFQIIWNSYPPHSYEELFSIIKNEAEKIWWENCPF